jgi:hypothetical protein
MFHSQNKTFFHPFPVTKSNGTNHTHLDSPKTTRPFGQPVSFHDAPSRSHIRAREVNQSMNLFRFLSDAFRRLAHLHFSISTLHSTLEWLWSILFLNDCQQVPWNLLRNCFVLTRKADKRGTSHNSRYRGTVRSPPANHTMFKGYWTTVVDSMGWIPILLGSRCYVFTAWNPLDPQVKGYSHSVSEMVTMKLPTSTTSPSISEQFEQEIGWGCVEKLKCF